MDGEVSYEEEQPFVNPAQQVVRKQSALVRLVFSLGLAKTEQQAQYVLLGAAVLFFLLSIGLYVFASPQQGTVVTPSSPNWPKSAAERQSTL